MNRLAGRMVQYLDDETEDERAERWRKIKARRTARGLCWQCAKPIADCKCPGKTAGAEPRVECPLCGAMVPADAGHRYLIPNGR